MTNVKSSYNQDNYLTWHPNATGFDFSRIGIQPKLKVNQHDDMYEQEADRVAEQVMRMPISDSVVPMTSAKEEGIDRKCSSCEMQKEKEEIIEIGRKPSSIFNLEASDEVTHEINNIRSSSGSPLDPRTKEFMESRFGHDFSKVKIHADERAARSSNSLNALAYTVGNHIVFGQGQYQPNTLQGRRLLAHELTHVVQQSSTDANRDGQSNEKAEMTKNHSLLAHEPGHIIQQSYLTSNMTLQRAPDNNPKSPTFSGTAELQSVMLQLFEMLAPDTVKNLTINKTIAIGWVSGPGLFQKVFTVNGNWINADLTQAAERLGLMRWDPRPELVGERAIIGAAADAEQLMIDHAEAIGQRVEALAVSRPVCEHCEVRIAHHHRGDILVAEVDIPNKATSSSKPSTSTASKPPSINRPSQPTMPASEPAPSEYRGFSHVIKSAVEKAGLSHSPPIKSSSAAQSGPLPVPAGPSQSTITGSQTPASPVSPLTIPQEGVDMPWVGRGRGINSSDLGYLRDPSYFWGEYGRMYGSQLSPANITLINNGQSPRVDATWILFHPEHAGYAGDILEHHHVGQGSRAVPIPERLHDAYTVFHPQRRVVGTPGGGTRPLPPQPTPAYTQAEIDRHVRAGRITGPGITPASSLPAPQIPVSSEVAGMPQGSQVSQSALSSTSTSEPMVTPQEPGPSSPETAPIGPEEKPLSTHLGETTSTGVNVEQTQSSKAAGIKSTAKSIAGGAAGMGISWGLSMIASHFEQKKFEEDLKKLRASVVQTEKKKNRKEIIIRQMLEPSKPLYVNIIISIRHDTFIGIPEAGPITVYSGVEAESVNITNEYLNEELPYRDEGRFGQFTLWTRGVISEGPILIVASQKELADAELSINQQSKFWSNVSEEAKKYFRSMF